MLNYTDESKIKPGFSFYMESDDLRRHKVIGILRDGRESVVVYKYPGVNVRGWFYEVELVSELLSRLGSGLYHVKKNKEKKKRWWRRRK